MQPFLKRILHLVVLLTVVVELCGCSSEPIADDLSQNQAMTIVATLSQQGIPAVASRESGGRGRYTVTVRHQWYNQAVTILHERGLPKLEEMTFAETVAGRGFLPNSRDIEALKIDRAQAAEIEEAIRVMPAVGDVRVIVRRASVAEGVSPGVSAVIEVKEGGSVNPEDVRSVVSKAVPGITKENIFISTVNATPLRPITDTQGVKTEDGRVMYVPLAPFLAYWHIPEGDVAGLSLTLLIGLILIGGIGGFLGYWYGYLQQTRVMTDQNLPDLPRGLRGLERQRPLGIEEDNTEQ